MHQDDIEKLKKAYAVELDRLQTRVHTLEKEVERLKELLRTQQGQQFGKSSETSSNLNLNLNLKPEEQTKEPRTTTVSAHSRTLGKRGKRQCSYDALPRYTRTYDLLESEKICVHCQGPLHCIGEEKSEQLELIPVQYCKVQHLRFKYSCRCCETVITAPKTPAPLPKALAGGSVLTDVVLNKYQYHLPLYRQSKIMKSYGLTLSDKTLANWVMDSGELLKPVYEAFWVVLKNRYLQVDETPVKVLETNKKGYIWAYFAPCQGKGLIAFEFSLTREGSVAFERLRTFNGLLHTDAYKGYEALRKREGIIGFGCFSHLRRKFAEVVKISADTQGIAATFIKKVKPLYALEERLRKTNAAHRTRKRLRQKIAKPILQELHAWLGAEQSKVPPKSKLGKAIAHALRQWNYCTAYLRHGMAEIDTNYVENKSRDIALGKKNWLSIGNERSGAIHALWYSLIISAILNNLNPRVYIHYLLSQAHQLRKGLVNPETLLPDRIDLALLEQFASEQIAFGQKIMSSFCFDSS